MKYQIDGNVLYLFWPSLLTTSYTLSDGIDGQYIVFDDLLKAVCFATDIESLDSVDSLDVIAIHPFDSLEDNAVKLSELLELIDKGNQNGY